MHVRYLVCRFQFAVSFSHIDDPYLQVASFLSHACSSISSPMCRPQTLSLQTTVDDHTTYSMTSQSKNDKATAYSETSSSWLLSNISILPSPCRIAYHPQSPVAVPQKDQPFVCFTCRVISWTIQIWSMSWLWQKELQQKSARSWQALVKQTGRSGMRVRSSDLSLTGPHCCSFWSPTSQSPIACTRHHCHRWFRRVFSPFFIIHVLPSTYTSLYTSSSVCLWQTKEISPKPDASDLIWINHLLIFHGPSDQYQHQATIIANRWEPYCTATTLQCHRRWQQ